MYLLVLSISNSAGQLLATFVDINLQWEDKESGSDRLIQYAEICFCLLTGDSWDVDRKNGKLSIKSYIRKMEYWRSNFPTIFPQKRKKIKRQYIM